MRVLPSLLHRAPGGARPFRRAAAAVIAAAEDLPGLSWLRAEQLPLALEHLVQRGCPSWGGSACRAVSAISITISE